MTLGPKWAQLKFELFNIYSLKTIAPTLLSYRIIVVALLHFALSNFLHVRFLHEVESCVNSETLIFLAYCCKNFKKKVSNAFYFFCLGINPKKMSYHIRERGWDGGNFIHYKWIIFP